MQRALALQALAQSSQLAAETFLLMSRAGTLPTMGATSTSPVVASVTAYAGLGLEMGRYQAPSAIYGEDSRQRTLQWISKC
jgi:hypothetical protein